MKKIIALIIAMILIGIFAGCSSNTSSNKGNLTGLVTYLDGTKAEGAVVRLYPYYSTIITASTSTDIDGKFAFNEVPEGFYEIVITKGEYSAVTVFAVRAEDTLPVPPENTVLKITNSRRLVPGDTFTGTITAGGTSSNITQTATAKKYVAKYPMTSFDGKPISEMDITSGTPEVTTQVSFMRNADNSVYSVTGTPEGSLFNMSSASIVKCIIPAGELKTGVKWDYVIQGAAPAKATIVAEENMTIKGETFKTFKYNVPNDFGSNDEYWICPLLGTIVKSKYYTSATDTVEMVITSFDLYVEEEA